MTEEEKRYFTFLQKKFGLFYDKDRKQLGRYRRVWDTSAMGYHHEVLVFDISPKEALEYILNKWPVFDYDSNKIVVEMWEYINNGQ